MTLIYKFAIIFCTVLYSVNCEVEGRGWFIDHGLSDFCAQYQREARSNKLFCIICKGFDPACFVKTTTRAPTTTTSTSTTTEAPKTTETPKTTSSRPTNGTTSATPSTKSEAEENEEPAEE